MDDEIERLRIENRRLATESARLRERNSAHVRLPESGWRTSGADVDLLVTAAEKTRMPQIVTDPTYRTIPSSSPTGPSRSYAATRPKS